MFPIDLDLEELAEKAEQEQTERASKIGRSFLFDYASGQHRIIDGAVVECSELMAVKQWLELMVKTALDKYQVYENTGFGTSAEMFIGRRTLPKGFVASELEREVKESCTLNPAIDRAENFDLSRTVRGMQISFTVYMKNGDTLEVREDV